MPDREKLAQEFPLAGWGVEDLRFRAFNSEDGAAYHDLSVGDPEFHWDREEKPRAFADFMIQFRMDHYAKYGFGIMACYSGPQFIGQAGVQVIPEHPDDVELAVFLARPFRGRGWGRLLNLELMRRCRLAGLERVYATVRQDNLTARNLMLQLGGLVKDAGIHYGQKAVEYSFQLKGEDNANL
jgi:RimJ/RimL family protein N-acetyltransferase